MVQDVLIAADWRTIKGQALASASSGRQPVRKQFVDPTSSLSDSKSTEASTSISIDELYAVDSAAVPSTSRAAEVLLMISVPCLYHKKLLLVLIDPEFSLILQFYTKACDKHPTCVLFVTTKNLTFSNSFSMVLDVASVSKF